MRCPQDGVHRPVLLVMVYHHQEHRSGCGLYAKMNLSVEVDLEDYVSRQDKISDADVS